MSHKKPFLVDEFNFITIYSCNKCDYYTFCYNKIIDHCVSEHIKSKKKTKIRVCDSCGLPLRQCSLNMACPRSNPPKITRRQAREAKNILLDIKSKK